MRKRFTDTDIWDQDWYVELPTKYKLFWNYIKDKCDNVGVWRPNKAIIQRIIGEPISFNEFLTFVNADGKERISVIANGRWFLTAFFMFQYGDEFSPQSPVHRGALKQLLANGIHICDLYKVRSGNLQYLDFEKLKQIAYDKAFTSLIEAYQKPTDRHKDKDKDKDSIKSTTVSNSLSIRSLKKEKSENAIFAIGEKNKDFSFPLDSIGTITINMINSGNNAVVNSLKNFIENSNGSFSAILQTTEFNTPEVFQKKLQEFILMIQKQDQVIGVKDLKAYFANWLESPKQQRKHTKSTKAQSIFLNGIEHKPLQYGKVVTYNSIRGVRFNEEKTKVLLQDGEWQELGKNQLSRLRQSDLDPSDCFKGYIN